MTTVATERGERTGAAPRPLAARAVPSVADLLFAFWAFAIALAFHHRLVNSDGDLMRHLRLGTWMLDHGRLVTVDRFSHTAYGRPFIAYEWLSEVVLAGVNRIGGVSGIVAFSAILLGLTAFVLMRFLQRRGVDVALAYLAASGALLLTSPHWLARPHLFSFLGTACVLCLLDPRERVRPWLYAPLFLLWANLHPGFVFGLALIGMYLTADALDWLRARSPALLATIRLRAASLAVALGVSLITPGGVRQVSHVLGTLGDRYLMDMTQEFVSPDFHTPTGKAFLLVLLAVAGVLIYRGKRPRTVTLLAFLALTAMALNARRNIPLFGLVVFPLLALELDADWRALGGLLGRLRATVARQDAQAGVGAWAAGAALLLAGIGVNGGTLAGARLLPDRFDARVFPVQAVAAARAAHLEGKLFHDFAWGGYLLWAWPEQKVYIDGATDFYGSALLRSYVSIEHEYPGWQAALDRRGISLVLLSRNTALATDLKREPAWRIWHEDSTAVLFVRAGGPAPAASRPNAGAPGT